MKIKLDSHGRPTGLIKFTKRQQESIGLLIAMVRDSNGESAILGQVFATGIACKICSPEESRAIGKITGTTTPYAYSPEEQYPG